MIRSQLRAIGVPVVASVAAMGLRTLLEPWLGPHELFFFALPAVAVTQWVAGLRAATLCAVLCLLWLVAPIAPFMPNELVPRVAVIGVALAGIVITLVCVEYVKRTVRGLDAKARAAERAALEARLLLAENRFSRMATTSPNVIYVYDMVTRENVYVNRRFSDILGLGPLPNDRMGAEIANLCHPDDRAIVRAAHERLQAAGDDEIVEYEIRLRHSQGHWVWFRQRSTVFTRLPNGRPREILGNGEDITFTRAAARALEDSEARFQRMADTIADVLYIFDLKMLRTTYINSRVFANLGYSADAVRSMGAEVLSELVHPEDRTRVLERVQHFRDLEDGAVYELEYRMRHAQGHYIWLLSRETVFQRDESGRAVQILGTAEDVTEMRSAREALELAAKRKDEFLAMLAHELRNPLAPIRNAAQVIKLVDRSGSTRLQWAREVIERQSAHMARLVDDLLDVSRTTTGKVTLRREPTDIASLVHRAIEQGRPLVESRHLILETVVADGTTLLDVDPARIIQVIGNLVNNASKYSEEGGHVRVSARALGDWAEISVSDTGIGIAPEFLPHVFDLFSQGAHSLDRAQGGLGIGLTLVKTLVELHGGTVAAVSEGVGRGSTFSVRLPIASESLARREVKVAPPSKETQVKHRVLIVDDNVDSAEMLRVIVEEQGFSTAVSHDGLAAVAVVESYKPDVAILDLGLPGIDGYEVAARVRARPGPQPVLIALTGYGQPEDRQRSQASGFDHHLVKPAEPETLTALLRSIVQASAVDPAAPAAALTD